MSLPLDESRPSAPRNLAPTFANSPSTHWSVIQQAITGSPDRVAEAFDRLVKQYDGTMRRYLVGSPWRLAPDVADDIVQEFWIAKILNKYLLEKADPERGRFRTLLKVALNNFVRNRIRSPTMLQEGDEPLDVCDSDASAPDHFEVQWARDILQELVARFRVECQQREMMHVWGIFEARLLRPVMHRTGPVSYEELAEELGFDEVKAAMHVLTTSKRILQRLFDEIVKRFSQDAAEQRLEQVNLCQIFQRGISLAGPFDHGVDSDNAGSRAVPSSGNFNRTYDSWLLAKVLELPPQKSHRDNIDLKGTLDGFLQNKLGDFLLLSPVLNEPSLAPGLTQDSRLSDLLFAENPPMNWLQALKRWCKKEFASTDTDVSPEVVSVIYFASIAAARLRCRQSLTKLSDDSLQQSFQSLLESSWIDGRVQQLLREMLETLAGDENGAR